jgi:hypothetical protein
MAKIGIEIAASTYLVVDADALSKLADSIEDCPVVKWDWETHRYYKATDDDSGVKLTSIILPDNIDKAGLKPLKLEE